MVNRRVWIIFAVQDIMTMAIYGYILGTASEEVFQKMKDLGCCRVFVEAGYDEMSRPKRRQLLKLIEEGDTIIIPRFCHITSRCSGLSAFLNICRIKQLRLVSVEDQVDTAGTLFGQSSEANLLKTIRSFPVDVADMKTRLGNKPIKIIRTTPAAKAKRMKRDEQVINLYLSGISLEDIKKATGIGTSTLYNILHNSNISCRRLGSKGSTDK